jgi:integrase
MSPHYGKFVAYFRVSTDRQGKSGLGLDAQRQAVMSYLNGGRWTLVSEFTEVESGKRDDNRPQLAAAIAACKRQKARLVIAKNGRTPIAALSRLEGRLSETSGVKGWSLHDLRRTARSLMSRAGVPADHAERCLGHVIGGVRGVYDRHEYLQEKKVAFEALAAQVERIINPREKM